MLVDPRSSLRYHWKEESIKTRIETVYHPDSVFFPIIEKKNPLKQGLKHTWTEIKREKNRIEKKNPLKQGLKHLIKKDN